LERTYGVRMTTVEAFVRTSVEKYLQS